MFGPPRGEEGEANRKMANSQVKISFIQFCVVVGVINIAPYILEAIMGEPVR